MVDVDKIRGLMAEKKIDQQEMANLLGITRQTFRKKMERKCFSTDEMAILIQSLDIKHPMPIFYAENVS